VKARIASVAFALVATFSASAVSAAPITFTTFSAAGPDAASIQPTVDAFRAVLGTLNPNVAGSFGSGRREINWDGVGAAFNDPNPFPGNFFNSNSPRGVEFSTPGDGFMVSTNNVSATPVLFGFPNDFSTFSPQRLFTAVNSTTTDVRFFIPASSTPAVTTGFGVVFTDVEVADTTKIEFFDINDNSIFSAFAAVSGNQGLSFIGGIGDVAGVSRVRITSGVNTIVSNGVLGNPNDDVVAMDDFIYGEPLEITAVPEPASLFLFGSGILLVAARYKKRR
jgi:hypothetical protein